MKSWLGSGYSDYEDYQAQQEQRQEEAREYWSKAPLMVRFTAKVYDLIREAYEQEARRTASGKRSAEFWRLDDAIRAYQKRLEYYQAQY